MPDRFLVLNASDLDSAGRILAMRARFHNETTFAKKVIACLAFFDFAAAFASIIHGWIIAVLVFQGFPTRFVNLVKTLHYDNGAYSTMTRQLVFFLLLPVGGYPRMPRFRFSL